MSRHLPPVCPGPQSPLTRRSFLQVGALSATGLCLSDLLRLREQAQASTGATSSPDTAVLLVWLSGGPPHHETYDLKPDAPDEIRGDFLPIRTNVPGIYVSEMLPLHAKCADKYTLIRSIHHEFADHGGGHKRFLTGRRPAQPDGFVNDAPAVPTIVSKCREHITRGLPNVIQLTPPGREGVDTFSHGAAYLGPAFNPFIVGGNPSKENFEVRNLALQPGVARRLDDRMTMLKGFDRMRRDLDSSGTMDAMDTYNRRAMELLTSSAAREAFDLSKEKPELRARYGNHAWGQRALLGRRLIEAGCSFVTVVMENPAGGGPIPHDALYNWDSHAVNCHIFIDARWRLPYLDQAVTALIEDVHARGLNKKLMVIVTGEFGRSPRIENKDGRPGRDHWPNAMSVLVAGAVKTGQVIGSTDKDGAHPKDRPLTPNDLWATAYQHLGIDYHSAFHDHQGRPMHILPFGEPIKELV